MYDNKFKGILNEMYSARILYLLAKELDSRLTPFTPNVYKENISQNNFLSNSDYLNYIC